MFKKKEPKMVEREDGLVDYNVYIMSKNERLATILISAIVIFAIGYIFYHSVIICAVIALLSFKIPELRTKSIIKKRKEKLNIEFKDMLYAISSSLVAGKSIEMAFTESLKDLAIIYPDENTDIIRETKYIVRGLGMNETVENMLQQFADRTHIEDIENFADIFKTCKRSGGNIVEMVRTTSNVIADKIDIKREIATLVTAKKYEHKILSCLPIVLMMYLSTAAQDYMEPLFNGIIGRVTMTTAVALFVISFFIGNKITDIEV